MSLNHLCLVLNASYEPIHVAGARRALTLVFKGAAVVEEVSAATIRTARMKVPVPSVIRLRGIAGCRARTGRFRGKASCYATGILANIATPLWHPAA